MVYKIKNDTYVYPDTNILRNKLGITDRTKLDEAEFSVTAVELAILEEYPIRGDFDLDHLRTIHRQLFKDLYEWAGELRTVEISKDQTSFARVEHLEYSANELFKLLKDEKWLKGLDETRFIERFAHYYSEVNILHPFREGNGRVQRAYFTLLARYCGYHVAWDYMIQDDNINASITAYHGDEKPLVEILLPLLEWVHEDYWDMYLE